MTKKLENQKSNFRLRIWEFGLIEDQRIGITIHGNEYLLNQDEAERFNDDLGRIIKLLKPDEAKQ